MAGVGHLKRIWKDPCRVARAVPETCLSNCILEHQIFRFAEMILCDLCSTSYGPASLCHGKRGTLDMCSGKVAQHNGRRPSALHSAFFCRKSRRIASLMMLSTSSFEFEEVLHICFVSDVAGCQAGSFRKYRRIFSFSSLQVDGWIERQLQLQLGR